MTFGLLSRKEMEIEAAPATVCRPRTRSKDPNYNAEFPWGEKSVIRVVATHTNNIEYIALNLPT